MNIIKEIFANEVFPAIGCTEPISCAYAAAAAIEQLQEPAQKIILTVDPGTFKNGAAVTVPNSGGQKGNLIAAALGAVIAKSSLRLEILKEVPPDLLNKANELISKGILEYRCKEDEKAFHVEVSVHGKANHVHCIVSEGHTNITCLEKNGASIIHTHPHRGTKKKDYHDILKKMRLEEVIEAAIKLDDEDRAYIQKGIEMNMAISEKGIAMKRTGYQIQQMNKRGLLSDDLFYKVKWRVASAVDARMGGIAEPVMTSGGSGNQGVLTILVPYIAGINYNLSAKAIQESIGISHAINSYIKCFTGELSVLCGCTIAASTAAAIALVYQKAGIDMKKMTYAVDNVVGDLCGIICDGAKPGCAMKIVTGVDTVIRSAFMAISDYGLSSDEGVLGRSAEESIRNLGQISFEGMGLVDQTVVHIIQNKTGRSGRA